MISAKKNKSVVNEQQFYMHNWSQCCKAFSRSDVEFQTSGNQFETVNDFQNTPLNTCINIRRRVLRGSQFLHRMEVLM